MYLAHCCAELAVSSPNGRQYSLRRPAAPLTKTLYDSSRKQTVITWSFKKRHDANEHILKTTLSFLPSFIDYYNIETVYIVQK